MLAPTPKNLSICQNLQLKIHRLKVHFIKSKMSRLTVCTFLSLDGAHCIKFNFSDRSIAFVKLLHCVHLKCNALSYTDPCKKVTLLIIVFLHFQVSKFLALFLKIGMEANLFWLVNHRHL